MGNLHGGLLLSDMEWPCTAPVYGSLLAHFHPSFNPFISHDTTPIQGVCRPPLAPTIYTTLLHLQSDSFSILKWMSTILSGFLVSLEF